MPLELSLDNKTWRKKNRKKKNDDKYPIFDVEVGQKICLGALFSTRSFCTGVLLVSALFCLIILTKICPRTRLSLVRKNECILSKLHTRLNTSGKRPAFRQNSISENK